MVLSVHGIIKRLIAPYLRSVRPDVEVGTLLAARQACWAMRRLDRLESLADVEFRVSSQWGEDGIIEWLIQNLPPIPETFVEFGVEDYREANTRFLIQNRNWKGLIFDGDAENIASVQRESIYWRHDLTAVCAFLTRENINDRIARYGLSGEIGLLSIDIDGNDYWVWDAINIIDPVIVICEYNAVLGDIHPITVPYRSDFDRSRAHHSNLYCGASIAALCRLAERKGYVLVGSNLAGTNAFFVRQTDAEPILKRIDNTAARPSSLRESRDPDGRLNFLSGLDRLHEIDDLPFDRVDTEETVTLASLPTPYSRTWRAMLSTPDSQPARGGGKTD